MKTRIFEKSCSVNTSVEEVFRWHARPGAIERYSPPWDPIQVVRRTGGIEKGAEVAIRMKAGPVPFIWKARHIDFEENTVFKDKQIWGPFTKWIHTHKFKPSGQAQTIMTDSVEYALLPHPFRNLLSYRLIEKKLDRIFRYRHDCLKHDLRIHLGYPFEKPLKILVSGSSGLIGSNLIPFLTTAGHQVKKLVRYQRKSQDEVFWDPASNRLDIEGLENLDAVIHLAGENIGEGRWTKEKKQKILASRVKGTGQLVEAFSRLKHPPKVFLSASAIGYYGNKGDTILHEDATFGSDFISDVCRQWESAAWDASKLGIRTALLRIGVVLDPRGGALQRLAVAFRSGLAINLAPGSQYVSWIGLNDTIDSIYHLLFSDGISGPVNIVAPNPVTIDALTHQLKLTLGGVVKFSIPESAITAFFGEKGKEVLLSSTRVSPSVLLDSGFQFRNESVSHLLHTVLGKQLKGKE